MSKSINAQFSVDWQKAVAWAQTQGISSRDYLPIYQQDAQNVANGDYPMSPAERNRAILSAANPNNVTPATSDHPSPASLLGNSRTDLTNIFTGLAPNHLIPNIFHTAEATLLHPSTWINPVKDVAEGVATGNSKQIKAGLAAAGGQNSVLSWIPGVYDLSELAKGGVDAVLEHPVVSFLDVAPFAPAGRVLSLAADEARMATISAKLGFATPDALYKASVPQMAASYVMSREIAVDADGVWQPRFPGAGSLTKGTLATRVMDPATGKVTYEPLTVGGAFRQWGSAHSGLSKGISFVAASAYDLKSYGTESEMFTVHPFDEAMANLKDPAQRQLLSDLVMKKDPRAQGHTPFQVMADQTIDPDVRKAYDLALDVRDMGTSRALAGNSLVAVDGPDITIRTPDGPKVMHYQDYYGLSAGMPSVVSASREAVHATLNLVKAMGPAHKISEEVKQLDQQFNDYATQTTKALEDARRANLPGNSEKLDVRDANGRVVRKVALPLQRQADLLMADDGLIAKALESGSKSYGPERRYEAKDPDFVTMLAQLKAAQRDLHRNGYGRLDTSDPTIDPAFAEVARRVDVLVKYAEKRVAREREFLDELTKDTAKIKRKNPNTQKALKDPAELASRLAHNEKRSSIIKALNSAIAAQRRFEKEWWDNPADRWRPALYDALIDKVLKGEDKIHRTEEMVSVWRERGYADEQIQKMRSDPQVLAQAIWHESRMAASNPNGRMILDEDDIEQIYHSGMDQVNKLRGQGHEVEYLPVVSSGDFDSEDPGRYGVQLSDKAAPRQLSSTKGRNMHDIMPERYDLVASLHKATKEAIERDITIEFAAEHLMPASLTAGEVSEWLQVAHRDEFANRDPGINNLPDKEADLLAGRMGLRRWYPMAAMGFTLPRWGEDAIYLPKGLADAVDDLLGSQKRFPLEGVYNKGTNAFRFSILALSPRYTAHIVFGGAFLLALRSDPRIVFKMGDAYDMVKKGDMDIKLRQGATERGIESATYPSYEAELQTKGLEATNHAGGMQMAHMYAQKILGEKGVIWSKASPVQWVKALGEANYRFTNFVSSMYRAASYLSESDKAMRDGIRDPDTGVKTAMTPERAKEIGIQEALKVMGNLKAMTPFERRTFMRIMPFYGWTRHILNYVLTYPVDHPYRASFLSTVATQDSDSVSKALDTRILFMFFMGSPDDKGNVKGVDVRFLDPLRDVANYSTLAGWIQALNPVIEAPLAAIDPNLIYGTTSLYPSVTYDQFYGIEQTTNPGGAFNALEQIIPQTGALDAALNLSGQYRSLAQKNPAAFAKTIYESLNIPFANVQDVNMKQLAAKGELARYRVASTAAQNAWQQPGLGGDGVERALAGYSSVPSPLNPDYEITPAQLQQVYNAALAEYPGQNPSEEVASPPNPQGY